MDWNHNLQIIIDDVELHLQQREDSICPADIARKAQCSYSFFQKVFSYLNGISFAEYIRYRKLTLAGYDVISTNLKVVEISYKYGWDSPTSFTKAFQQFHGVSPTYARKHQSHMRVYPKMQRNGNAIYQWNVVGHPAMNFIGRQAVITAEQDLTRAIPALWSRCQQDGSYASLITMDKGQPSGIFGMLQEQDDAMVYTLQVISDARDVDGYVNISLPAATWAIFECCGPIPQAIQHCWKYLHEEWLVQYPFEHADLPDLEWYSEGNIFDEHYTSQIWIPVTRRE